MSNNYTERESKYYMQVVNRLPLQIVAGRGTYVTDGAGREYLDLTAGWSCLNLGHSHPAVTKAIQEQADRIVQTTNLFYTEPQLDLAQMLIDNSALDRIFFTNSGAEANEGACKLARKWGKTRLNGAYEIITALNSFHGRTMAMMAATGQPKYHEAWQPIMPGFVNVPFNDVEAVRKATTDKTCAVLVEPVQGEGGVNVPDADYLSQLQSWCKERGILFMLDEVQTGMGRLGTLFGYQSFDGVEPDVVTLAKALGGGTPLGAFACKEFCSVLQPGDHGSTFGGNALTTAAGAATVKYMLDNEVPARAYAMSQELRSKLEGLKETSGAIARIKGKGLLLGIKLKADLAREVVLRALERGLILNAVRPDTVRLLPPLTISVAEIEAAISIIRRVLEDLETQL